MKDVTERDGVTGKFSWWFCNELAAWLWRSPFSFLGLLLLTHKMRRLDQLLSKGPGSTSMLWLWDTCDLLFGQGPCPPSPRTLSSGQPWLCHLQAWCPQTSYPTSMSFSFLYVKGTNIHLHLVLMPEWVHDLPHKGTFFLKYKPSGMGRIGKEAKAVTFWKLGSKWTNSKRLSRKKK